MPDRPLAAARTRNVWRDPALALVSAEPDGIVARAEGRASHPACRRGQCRHGDCHVADVAGRQREGAGAATDIGWCMELGDPATIAALLAIQRAV